ncbi:MAG: hypothetical protein Q9M24_09355 [Mariprofundaceae bacterium]|nr:hypothetical protein [Mariprofundaceae bacterium]
MRITLSIPDEVAERFRSAIPPRKRSSVVVHLIERELDQRDKILAAACIAANRDESLRKEIDEWQSFDDALEE